MADKKRLRKSTKKSTQPTAKDQETTVQAIMEEHAGKWHQAG